MRPFSQESAKGEKRMQSGALDPRTGGRGSLPCHQFCMLSSIALVPSARHIRCALCYSLGDHLAQFIQQFIIFKRIDSMYIYTHKVHIGL